MPPIPNAGKGASLDVGGDKIKKVASRPQSHKTTVVGISLLNSHNQSSVCPTAAPVEAALGVLWPPRWRWEWGGKGGVVWSRCSLIVPTDCAPLDADGAVSSIMAMR